MAIKDIINNDKGKKLIMYWGNSVTDLLDNKSESGYLIAQYYPESLGVGRSAEYESSQMSFGVGDILTWSSTSGISLDGLSLSFSRDRVENEILWQNRHNYDVEAIISLMYSFLVPKHEEAGKITALPPMIWFDFGYDIYGYGNLTSNDFSNKELNSVNDDENFISLSTLGVTRFYITGVNHTIDAFFPNTNKIRAVTFELEVQESVFYEGKINSTKISKMYRKNLNRIKSNYSSNVEKGREKYVNWNF